jgi:hypothetical protein
VALTVVHIDPAAGATVVIAPAVALYSLRVAAAPWRPGARRIDGDLGALGQPPVGPGDRLRRADAVVDQTLAGGERRQGRLGAHGGGHLRAPREPGQMHTVATARRQVSK